MHDPCRNEAWRMLSTTPSTGMTLSSKTWALLSESWRLNSTMSAATSSSSAVTMKPYSTIRWSWRLRSEHIMESWTERKADSTLQRKACFQSAYNRRTRLKKSRLKSLNFLESLPRFSVHDPRPISQISHNVLLYCRFHSGSSVPEGRTEPTSGPQSSQQTEGTVSIYRKYFLNDLIVLWVIGLTLTMKIKPVLMFSVRF